jgi:hypothetical protein
MGMFGRGNADTLMYFLLFIDRITSCCITCPVTLVQTRGGQSMEETLTAETHASVMHAYFGCTFLQNH